MKCENCGRGIGGNVARVKCKCGTVVEIEPKERVRMSRSNVPQFVYERRDICEACPKRRGAFCGVLIDRKKGAFIEGVRGIHSEKACCPDDPPRWLPVSQISDKWRQPVERVSHEKNRVVVSAADARYIRGVYFMVWTLLRINDVRVVVYLDNVANGDPHAEQMRSWGVELRTMPTPIPSSVKWYQTWNKPFCIYDTMNEDDLVLWLDADTSAGGSVGPAFDWIAERPFASDHGGCEKDQTNDPDIHALLGDPVRIWKTGEFPCAGVVGFRSSRDANFVEEWGRRCELVSRKPKLWIRGKEAPLKFYDQGVLQDMFVEDTADGRIWSNFLVSRKGTMEEMLEKTFSGERVINHYGGGLKPWFGWPKVLDWGSPF